MYTLLRHKLPNLLFFPFLIGMAKVYLYTPKRYSHFKTMSRNKLFGFQWRILDRIMQRVHMEANDE